MDEKFLERVNDLRTVSGGTGASHGPTPQTHADLSVVLCSSCFLFLPKQETREGLGTLFRSSYSRTCQDKMSKKPRF